VATSNLDQTVLTEINHGVALVTLNRPERLNAWTPTLERDYFDVLDVLDDDPDVRVIVLTGAGRGFCPGLDFAELSERTGRRDPTTPRTRPATYPLAVRKPLIAAVNGACAGIGLLQALVCDVRFASEEARMSTAFTRRGLVAEMGMPWLLVRLVGHAHATDLLLSGRTITGQEAAEIGLVSRAVAPELVVQVAVEYAEQLAVNCSPTSIALVKAQLAAEWERSMADSAAEAVRLVSGPTLKDDFAEGVKSFTEKRPPRFAPLQPRSLTVGRGESTLGVQRVQPDQSNVRVEVRAT
jgi:enoyl-CoA hydratase/carnithine racemase